MGWWCFGALGRALDLKHSGSKSYSGQKLRNNLGQVMYLSPSSKTWYQPSGGDALRLGR